MHAYNEEQQHVGERCLPGPDSGRLTTRAHSAQRMACARCPFYRPEDSLKEQLAEGEASLVHMLEFVSLAEDEKALVAGGVELHREFLERLADAPASVGPTLREREVKRQRDTKVIPLKSVPGARSQKSSEPSAYQASPGA